MSSAKWRLFCLGPNEWTLVVSSVPVDGRHSADSIVTCSSQNFSAIAGFEYFIFRLADNIENDQTDLNRYPGISAISTADQTCMIMSPSSITHSTLSVKQMTMVL